MSEKLKKVGETLLGTSFLLLFFLFVISIVAFFGGAIMTVFGFVYTSPWAVIQFFAFSAILEFPVTLFTRAFNMALFVSERANLTFARVLFVILDTLGGFFIMFLLDQYMLDVAATPLALFVVSFLFSLCSLKKFGKTSPQNLEELKECYGLDDLDDLDEQENKKSNQ